MSAANTTMDKVMFNHPAAMFSFFRYGAPGPQEAEDGDTNRFELLERVNLADMCKRNSAVDVNFGAYYRTPVERRTRTWLHLLGKRIDARHYARRSDARASANPCAVYSVAGGRQLVIALHNGAERSDSLSTEILLVQLLDEGQKFVDGAFVYFKSPCSLRNSLGPVVVTRAPSDPEQGPLVLPEVTYDAIMTSLDNSTLFAVGSWCLSAGGYMLAVEINNPELVADEAGTEGCPYFLFHAKFNPCAQLYSVRAVNTFKSLC